MVNTTCISRLSRYRSAVLRLKAVNFVKVFSENLADATGVTAAQVRKDFSMCGISGSGRGGYPINELIEQLNKVLGKDQVQKFVVVGIGNIGRALLHYPGFHRNEIEIVAGFDIDKTRHDRNAEVPILPPEELNEFIVNNSIRFGIITVPEIGAQDVLEAMLNAGIKGILNFAPICLKAPAGCVVRNLSLETELENVIYFTNIGMET